MPCVHLTLFISYIFSVFSFLFLEILLFQLEKFFKEKIVVVHFSKTMLYNDIHNTHLFHLKSFKHEILFSLRLSIFSEHTLHTSHTDISQTYRTFSLKINKLSICSEITQVWQCFKIVFIRSDKFSILNFNLRYKSHYSKYKGLCALCVYECLINIHTKFYLSTVFQS